MENEKTKSIFLGQVRRKTFYASYSDCDKIYENSELVEYKKICDCELDKPPLTGNEKIYITEMNKTLQVQEVIKSSDDSITYKTNYTIETIEDDKSKETYDKALKEVEKKKQENLQKQKVKDENEYIENDGISRCLITLNNSSIIAHFVNDNIQLIDTNSKSIITLSEYAIEHLLDFIKHIRTRY
jgi:IS30 family transposase